MTEQQDNTAFVSMQRLQQQLADKDSHLVTLREDLANAQH